MTRLSSCSQINTTKKALKHSDDDLLNITGMEKYTVGKQQIYNERKILLIMILKTMRDIILRGINYVLFYDNIADESLCVNTGS